LILALERETTPPPAFDPVTSVDPRRAPGGQLDSDRTAPDDGFFQPVKYRGAFDAYLWAAKWTNLDRLGYLPFCDGSNSAVPSEVIKLIVDKGEEATGLYWDAPPLANSMGHQRYDVLRSVTASNFDPAVCIEQEETDLTAFDSEVPAQNQVFHYLVRAVNDCGAGSLGPQNPPAPRTGSCQ
jgi:hypothetical protein